MTVGLANGIEEFWALELSFFDEMGRKAPDSMGRSRMIGAMSAGRVAFITAKRLGRPVGLCSVSRCFSSMDNSSRISPALFSLGFFFFLRSKDFLPIYPMLISR